MKPIIVLVSLLFTLMLSPLGLMVVWAADNEAVQPVHRLPGFWDGEWTDASSGYHYGYPDEGSSEGKSGEDRKDRAEHYWIPPKRQWEDVDPETLAEQEGWHYTPYAVVLFPTELKYGSWTLPVGYYQVKVGQSNDGSPKTRLNPNEVGTETPTLQGLEQRSPLKKPLKQRLNWPTRSKSQAEVALGNEVESSSTSLLNPLPPKPVALVPGQEAKTGFKKLAVWQQRPAIAGLGQAMVIQQLGVVKAVIPIVRTSPWSQETEAFTERPNRSHPVTGKLELRENRAVLKLTDGKRLFVGELDR